MKLPKLSVRLALNYSVVIIIVILLIILLRIYIVEPGQFRWEVPIIISCIAAICAAISIVLASRSLKTTENALELTRITVRPFLALQAGEVPRKQIKERVILEFHVKNTGIVPANVLTMEMTFFDDAELIEEDNASEYYQARKEERRDVVIFPGASYNLEQWFDLSHSNGKKQYEGILNGKVKLRFRTTYEAKGIEYITVQTEKVLKEGAGQMTRLPVQPQIWT